MRGSARSRVPALHAETTERGRQKQGHRGDGSIFMHTRRNCTEFTAAQQLIELTETKPKRKDLPHRRRK